MDELKLTKLDPENATVQGTNLAIEDRTTGKVYVTNKQNINKLFWKMGYRNLSVIKILEEFAGKFVSDIGHLNDCSLYLEEDTSSFIVTSDEAVSWINAMFQLFKNNRIEIKNYHRADACYTWDELTVKSPKRSNAYFDICINMVDESVHVLSMDYDESMQRLKGIQDEGVFRFHDISSANDLVDLILNPPDLSYSFYSDIEMSIEEYVRLLTVLGFAQIKRGGKAHLTDDGDQVKDTLGDVEYIIDEYNLKTWIQRRISTIPGGNYTFDFLCDLVSMYLDRITPWKVKDFYINNSKEVSDICLLRA